jgi:hypothetical protein
MPIPNEQAAPKQPEPVKPGKFDDTNPAHVQAVMESSNQLSRDYQEAWERHLMRLRKAGIE